MASLHVLLGAISRIASLRASVILFVFPLVSLKLIFKLDVLLREGVDQTL